MPELANPSGEPIYKAWQISGLKWILGLIAAGVIGRFLSDFFAAENPALRSFAPAPG